MKDNTPEKSSTPFIRVPKSILRRTDISQSGKLLYGLILCLSDETGYCFASDKYLAEQIGISLRQANRTITELEALRIVLVTGATSKRHIRPAYDKNGVSSIEIETPLTTKKAQVLTTKTSETYDKNVHIIDSNKKENIKEIVASLSPDKDPEQNKDPEQKEPAWSTLTPAEREPFLSQALRELKGIYPERASHIIPRLVDVRAKGLYEAGKGGGE